LDQFGDFEATFEVSNHLQLTTFSP